MEVNKYHPSVDPWIWVDDAVSGKGLAPDIGLVINDGATSQSEILLDWITKSPDKVGQQNTQRFTVNRGADRTLTVGANNESHYGLVQNFMRSMLWKSTELVDGVKDPVTGNLTRPPIDVLWTFGLFRGDGPDGTSRLGPLLAGKALTPVIPKWFRYVFPLVTIPTAPGQAPRHVLYLQEQADPVSGGMIFANARYPINATTTCPVTVEPASLVEALEIIAKGQQEAEDNVKLELGLI
jgi:hypothetical protein